MRRDGVVINHRNERRGDRHIILRAADQLIESSTQRKANTGLYRGIMALVRAGNTITGTTARLAIIVGTANAALGTNLWYTC